ncbi:zinc ribbon domain-containing protein [Novipirellula sp. SH528]|uniref:zinc ribbon domain-containing protein n=1 Tax=Novipirellula sp. SH528 TaxID=3454466 RepID=UPI003F9EEAE9
MMTHASSGARTKSKRYRYYVCSKATKRGRKTCPRPSLPAEEVERFIVAQLQSLTIDEKILNAICNRVRRSIDERRSEFIKEQTALATAIHRTERSIDSLSVPTSDAARETIRLDSLASLNEQHHRDRMRLCNLHEQLATINSATPDRVSILRAIDDLETLWDHMTLSERSRLMSLLIERIDHDPTDSNLSITLSPTGLESLDSITPTSETQTQ